MLSKVAFKLVCVLFALSLAACGMTPAAGPTAPAAVVASTDPPQPTATVAPTDTPIPPSPTPAPTDTPAATATPQPTATPAGPAKISDDFSSDQGRFKCDQCVVKDGALYMGPFPAVDKVNGYYAICADCPEVPNYKMTVDATYDSGPSDRGYGFLLRENDGSFIDLEIATWQVYGVWHFDATKGNSWNAWDKTFLKWSPGALKAGRQTNHIEVTMTATKTGSTVRISFNGKGGRVVELPEGTGKVGLLLGMHSLGVTFDNFTFEEIVP